MSRSSHLAAARENLRESLWLLPSIAVTGALIGGAALTRVRVDADTLIAALVFGGGADGARAVLQVVAGSVITVTSVTFSLTVVALTTAASLYSPRVLRTFLRDRGNQIVLSTFLATFAYCLVVLRTIRTGAGGGDVFVPRVALTGALVLALSSVAALVYFIHHITRSLRVETILEEIEQETLAVIARMERRSPDTAGSAGTTGREVTSDQPLPTHARPLHAHGSGYVHTISHQETLGFARERDLVIWYRRTVGEQVTAGTAIAWTWRPDGQPIDDTDEVERTANAGVHLVIDRTVEEDVAFGIRQLVDIAIRALSPSLNDPTTAVDALGHLSVLLCALARHDLGTQVHTDTDGVVRVCIPHPTYAQYLDLACTQIANYGAGDIAAVLGLFKMLGEVAETVTDPARVEAVSKQIDTALQRAEAKLPIDSDRRAAQHAAHNARSALHGAVTKGDAFTL